MRSPNRAHYDAEVEHGALFVGAPETVAQRLAATMRTLELDRLGLHYATGKVPAPLRRQSIELLGREGHQPLSMSLRTRTGPRDAVRC